MTESDIQTIERELGITLPEVYRKAVCPYPIPALAGEGEGELCDDPETIIKLNKEYHAAHFGLEPWPDWLYCVGEVDVEVQIAIDLRDPRAPTWWIDHSNWMSKHSYKKHDDFTTWVEAHVRDIRNDLTGDGYNPDTSPEEYAAQAKAANEANTRGCFILLAVVAAAAILLYLILKK